MHHHRVAQRFEIVAALQAANNPALAMRPRHSTHDARQVAEVLRFQTQPAHRIAKMRVKAGG